MSFLSFDKKIHPASIYRHYPWATCPSSQSPFYLCRANYKVSLLSFFVNGLLQGTVGKELCPFWCAVCTKVDTSYHEVLLPARCSLFEGTCMLFSHVMPVLHQPGHPFLIETFSCLPHLDATCHSSLGCEAIGWRPAWACPVVTNNKDGAWLMNWVHEP